MISQFSVKRPYTVLVAVTLAIVLGVISFSRMTTDLLPNMELPYVVVITSYPGASPERVEQFVTKPLEAVLGTAGGLKNISSISGENSSIIILELFQTVNMDTVMIELSNSVDMVSARLDSAVSKPVLLRINPDMMPILVATVDVEGKGIVEVSQFVNDTLLPAFERIEGVATVSASGLVETELLVSLDQDKIGDLNEKIIENMNKTFDMTRSRLTEALVELDSAIKALDEETQNKKEQLVEACIGLNGTIANLQALLAEETILNARKAAFEQEREGLLQLEGLKPVFTILFPNGVKSLSPEKYQMIIEQASPSLPQQLAGLSQEEMADVEETITNAPARLAAIESELQNISIRLSVFNAMKPQLEKGLEEALQGYRQVESAKISMAVELAKAQIQLENSKTELEKGLEELDKAGEKALDDADLSNMISTEMISNILKAQNFTMPAGYIQEGEHGHLVKVVGRFDSEESVSQTILFNIDGVGDIRLTDVANIELADNSQETYAKVNGNDCAVLVFQKQSTFSTAKVTGKIHSLIKDMSKEYPGLHILPVMDQGEYINMSVESVLQNLTIGGALAILVLLIFLKDFRPTMVIALSIPISLMAAVALMYFSGVSVNIISLSGLALGVGMLVDNSIVVIENIYRLRNQGVPLYRAAVYGTNQVAGAIFASTLTTVCVFLPIVFTQGISRQLFTDMGLTITYSLLASLVVAVSVIPTMASTALKNIRSKQQKWFDAFVNAYEKVLKFSLSHKVIVLLITVFLFGLSIYGINIIGTSFLPEMDTPQMSATLKAPQGIEKNDLYAINDQVVDRILEIDDVAYVCAMSGSSGGMGLFGGGGSLRGSSPDTSFYILLAENRTMTNKGVERLIIEKTQDLDVEISVSTNNVDLSILGGRGIEVNIKGNDLDQLDFTAQEVAGIFRSTEGIQKVITSNDDGDIETRIIIDKDAARREGLTVAQVYQAIAEALVTRTEATTLTAGQAKYPVIVVERKAITRDNLGEYVVTVTGQDGIKKETLLKDIAHIIEAPSPSSITRENQSRYVTVSASIADGYNIGLVSRDFEGKLKSYTPPAGIEIEIAGEMEIISEANRDIVLMIILAVIFIYLIMVAQFQSMLSPFIIMFTLPLAFTGGLLLLWIVGLELSVTALLGFLVLAGVVVNNGIIFVDHVNQLRLQGMDKYDALIATGRARIRPILMTAFTTILAMSTIALGYGSGAELTQPLAVVAIGGLTYATALTLLLIPVMYDFLHRRSMKKIDIEEKL